jgi:hypothetical protein
VKLASQFGVTPCSRGIELTLALFGLGGGFFCGITLVKPAPGFGKLRFRLRIHGLTVFCPLFCFFFGAREF